MRGLTRRWLLTAPGSPAAGSMETVPGSDGIAAPAGSPHPPGGLVQRILLARGLSDPEQVQRFCEPSLRHLHDPSLLPGVEAAAARIIDGLKRDEQIVIYGDYDVDGVTATAILFHTIRAIRPEARLRTYVPHRLEEGYGINCEALKQLRRDGAELVISVDCGITAVESARTAREIGLDLIITDHHNLPEDGVLPDAVALVHPRLQSSAEHQVPSAERSGLGTRNSELGTAPYPFGDLCGAGVAFKLAWRLATMWCNSERVSESLQKTLLNMLPLAALGTIADVVPLVGENRIITAFGLRLIKQTPIIGLRALIEASDLAGEHIDCEKVGFVLGPRLNACGRLGHAREAVRLLCDAGPEEAGAIARELARVNVQRQRTERDILSRAMELAEDRGMTRDDCRAIVLAHEDWHPGVVGIVCSRLVDRFSRPTILMQRNGEGCKGSARSIEGYSIHEGLSSCASLLATFGGHDMAAGLTVANENVEAFIEAFTAHANAHIQPQQLTPAIRIDCDALMAELDLPTVQRLLALSPFGRANRRPTVRIEAAVLTEAPRQIGAQGKHLSLRLRDGRGPASNQPGLSLRAVWWNAGRFAGDLAAGMRLDAAIEPKLNAWNGRVSVEAVIQDVRIAPAT